MIQLASKKICFDFSPSPQHVSLHVKTVAKNVVNRPSAASIRYSSSSLSETETRKRRVVFCDKGLTFKKKEKKKKKKQGALKTLLYKSWNAFNSLRLSSMYTHFNTLKMSNFTSFQNVCYAICILKSLCSHISVVVCSKFFEFGTLSKWCIREWVNM